MLQTEMLSLEQEKNSQFSPVSFDELSNILGGKKSVNNGNQKPTGSGGGNYGGNRFIMDKETALEFVNFCYRELDELECIMFFGGEPLLNWKIVEFICKEFEDRHKDGGCLNPKFTLVTNGTIYNRAILQMIGKYICSITVSVDGNEDINNYNRVYQNGNGSFLRISNFIHYIKKMENVELQYEATYTKAHEAKGYTRYDVKSFLTSYFGIKGIVVDEESLGLDCLNSSLETITQADILKTNFECLPNDFWHILYAIATKKPLSFCSIFQDRITISSSGEIYACQLLNGQKNNIIGDIREVGILDSIYKNHLSFFDNQCCNSCWAKPLCGGCVVQKFYDSKHKTLASVPNKAICAKVQKCIESTLVIIYRIRSSPETWHRLLEKVSSQ